LVPGPRHTTLTLRPPSSEQHGFRVRDFAARPERVRNRTRTRLHATDRGVRDRSVAHGKDHAGEQLVSPLLSDPHMRAAQAEVASEPCLRLSASGLHCAGQGSKEHFQVCVFRTVPALCTRSILIIRRNSACEKRRQGFRVQSDSFLRIILQPAPLPSCGNLTQSCPLCSQILWAYPAACQAALQIAAVLPVPHSAAPAARTARTAWAVRTAWAALAARRLQRVPCPQRTPCSGAAPPTRPRRPGGCVPPLEKRAASAPRLGALR
jgi:hypothetical protein